MEDVRCVIVDVVRRYQFARDAGLRQSANPAYGLPPRPGESSVET